MTNILESSEMVDKIFSLVELKLKNRILLLNRAILIYM